LAPKGGANYFGLLLEHFSQTRKKFVHATSLILVTHISPFSNSFVLFLATEIKEIKQSHAALSEKFKILDEEFEKIKGSFPEDGQQFKSHMSDWKLSAGILYATKVNQLNNGRFLDYMRPGVLPNDAWDEVYIKKTNHFFLSFSNLVQTGDHYGKEVDNEARLLMARWSDLMLDFFLDLKELEGLHKSIAEKYPSEYAGKFVLSYVLGKYPPFDVATTYLNFDLRKSILGDCNNKRIREIAKG
jgi:hypothetical protein